MFNLEALKALAENTPAGVFALSPLSVNLLLAACAALHDLDNWEQEGATLTEAEQDEITEAVEQCEGELLAGLE